MNEDDMTVQLITPQDINRYKHIYNYLHIGLVQIAFKPLTLQGLPESFLAVLRDARNKNWKQSLMGIIESSLSHGPVYFNVYPNLQLSLSDRNIFQALTLNVKTHGYNYLPGSEVICICYRIYFKPLKTMNPKCKKVNKPINETILIESNFDMSKITTRKAIKLDEIKFPQHWILEDNIPPTPLINNNIESIIQTSDGAVTIEFNKEIEYEHDLIKRTRSARSSHSYISPLDYKVEVPSTRASVDIRKINNLNIHDDIVYEAEASTPSEMNFTV